MRSPQISRSLWRRLRRVRPSRDGSLALRPCRVFLKDGRWLDRVYLVEEEEYLRHWKVPPGEDPSRTPLPLSAIVDVDESPTRLPARYADRIYRAGESWQRYTVFSLVLSDGRRLPYLMGHAVDFPQWPDDVTPDMVVASLPHEAPREFRHRTPAPHQADASHRWCLYRRLPARWPRAMAAVWALLTWGGVAVLVGSVRVLQVGLESLIPRADIVIRLKTLLRLDPSVLPALVMLVLQAGLIAAPLVRRKWWLLRLTAGVLMVPALLLSGEWWKLGLRVNGHGPYELLVVALLLWGIPLANLFLLLLPSPQASRGRRNTRQEAQQAPVAEADVSEPPHRPETEAGKSQVS
ncbi:MAG: hypothetical protein V3U86_03420 [Acidobacteriota bacterium]